MHFTLLTLFPEMFPGPLDYSLAGKALKAGIWDYKTVNIRDFASDKHGTVDDEAYGGGTGMVMRADVVAAALRANSQATPPTRWIYMSPRGKLLTQSVAYDLTKNSHIGILCGRYEGVDERVLEAHNIEEISIGDYILSGGEMAALTLMDSCIRLLDGVISKKEALIEESFGANEEYTGLLEYPLYTRPSVWEGRPVPDVLLSGNHKQIAEWRLAKAQSITQYRRPDLWQQYEDKPLDKTNKRNKEV